MKKIVNLTDEERDSMVSAGLKHVDMNYSFDQFTGLWVDLLEDIHKRYGSWDTREGYKRWHLLEAA
jgi:hypothetical protein